MNIGIISMQRIANYGSFLQAFSLKKQLEKRGAKVFFIDIVPGERLVSAPKRSVFSKIKRYFSGRLLKILEYRKVNSQMLKIHEDDYHKYLENTETPPSHFDIVVIGSDEVFNCCAPTSWGFSKQLFGYVDNADAVYTYAASCGSTTYEDVCRCGIQDAIVKGLKAMKGISVRDENTADFVKSISGIVPPIHLDPVFISDYDSFIDSTQIENLGDFLLVYSYSNRIVNPKEIRGIKDFAKKKNVKIICVGQPQGWCDTCICANCFELLHYFKKAKYVLSDTFHGTVFSIISNKNFAVLVRDSNYNKLYNLLTRFQLTSRIWTVQGDLEAIYLQPIDYAKVNQYRETLRQEAYQYLDKVVTEENI